MLQTGEVEAGADRGPGRDMEGMLGAVGERLRSLRQDRDLTLTQLSARCALSVSLLSRLETGKRQPTLDVLARLAGTYGVSLDRLVGMPEIGDPRVHLRPHRAANGGVIVPLTRYRSHTRAFKHVLGQREPRLATHEGHAWLYVLAGSLRLLLEHEEYRLEAGETAEFDALTPHWFGPIGASVEILHIFDARGGGSSRPMFDRT